MADELQRLKVAPAYDVQKLRSQEFKRCEGHCYLDHAAATLYSDSQIKEVFAELQSSLLGNPHSRHFPSDTATQIIESVRHRILEYFSTTAEEYDVIFTSGATDALKIVAEHFQWNGSCKLLHENNGVLSEDNTENWAGHRVKDNEEPRCENTSSRENHGAKVIHGAFVYVRENHTSVLGMRGPAYQANADVYCLQTKELREILGHDYDASWADQEIGSHVSCGDGSATIVRDNGHPTGKNMARMKEVKCIKQRRNCLFAYSGHCNFSGAKAPLEWIEKVQKGELNKILKTSPMNGKDKQLNDMIIKQDDPYWFVLLDAAGLSATSPLDLSKWKPDFIPVSFYKIFGYPTGLGCLLIRNRAWQVMTKNYYGGGTLLMVDSRKMVQVPRPGLHDRFEDGTLPFLGVLAVRHGLDTIRKLTGGMDNIKHHVFHLARYTHHCLQSYRHSSGSPVAQLYCEEKEWDVRTHGSIVNFNLLNSDGSYVGYAQVERVASLYNIHLRTGCFCNPGACQTYLDISHKRLLQQFKAGHVCGDSQDLVDRLPTGSVRVSFGYMSSYDDADLLLKMVRECFVDGPLFVDLSWIEKKLIGAAVANEDGGVADCELHDGCAVSEASKFALPVIKKKLCNAAEEETEWISENGLKYMDFKLDSLHSEKKVDKNARTQYPSIYEEPNAGKAVKLDLTEPNAGKAVKLDLTEPNAGKAVKLDLTEPNAGKAVKLDLTDIFIYPVKSCSGLSVQRWSVGQEGLKFDRRWMIVTSSGVTLTQKRLPVMSRINPQINLEAGILTLTCEGEDDFSVPLEPPVSRTTESSICGGRVCGDRVKGLDCGPEVGIWLSRVLGQSNLKLMHQINKRMRKVESVIHGQVRESLSLANESPYLVIHRPSVRKLLAEIQRNRLSELTEDELVKRFRGNLIIDGGSPYEEDCWTSITIDEHPFQIQGGCRRCQMVSVVPGTGECTQEPMLTLAATRGSSMKFGVHATAVAPITFSEIQEMSIYVGAPVAATNSIKIGDLQL